MAIKLTKWDVGDYLKTDEDRAYFIEASVAESVRENDPAFLVTALSEVAKSMGGGDAAVVMTAAAAGITASQSLLGTRAKRQVARRVLTPSARRRTRVVV
jgi:DNA-binding phage protein